MLHTYVYIFNYFWLGQSLFLARIGHAKIKEKPLKNNEAHYEGIGAVALHVCI
jgi:hypothetical protein